MFDRPIKRLLHVSRTVRNKGLSLTVWLVLTICFVISRCCVSSVLSNVSFFVVGFFFIVVAAGNTKCSSSKRSFFFLLNEVSWDSKKWFTSPGSNQKFHVTCCHKLCRCHTWTLTKPFWFLLLLYSLWNGAWGLVNLQLSTLHSCEMSESWSSSKHNFTVQPF